MLSCNRKAALVSSRQQERGATVFEQGWRCCIQLLGLGQAGGQGGAGIEAYCSEQGRNMGRCVVGWGGIMHSFKLRGCAAAGVG